MSRLGEKTTEFGEEECFEVKSNDDWLMTGVGLACNVNMVPTLNPTSKYGPRLNSGETMKKVNTGSPPPPTLNSSFGRVEVKILANNAQSGAR